jgi:hypothetical protein
MTDVIITLFTDFTRLAAPVSAFLASVMLIYVLLSWLWWRMRS